MLAAGPWLTRLLPDVSALQLEVTRQELVYFATPPGDGRFDAGELPTWVDYEGAFYGLPSIEGRGAEGRPGLAGPAGRPRPRGAAPLRRAGRGRARLRTAPVPGDRRAAGRRGPHLPVRDDRRTPISSSTAIPNWENVWIVGGGSGHAFKHGPTIGEYVSALVTGDDEAAAALAPDDDRFALRPRVAGQGMRTSGTAPER